MCYRHRAQASGGGGERKTAPAPTGTTAVIAAPPRTTVSATAAAAQVDLTERTHHTAPTTITAPGPDMTVSLAGIRTEAWRENYQRVHPEGFIINPQPEGKSYCIGISVDKVAFRTKLTLAEETLAQAMGINISVESSLAADALRAGGSQASGSGAQFIAPSPSMEMKSTPPPAHTSLPPPSGGAVPTQEVKASPPVALVPVMEMKTAVAAPLVPGYMSTGTGAEKMVMKLVAGQSPIYVVGQPFGMTIAQLASVQVA